MTKLCLVAAVGHNNVIGNNGDLPWAISDIPQDMAHFKAITSDQIVIMGRKTWDSIPNAPLKNRENIVITSSPETIHGGTGVRSVGEALAHADYINNEVVDITALPKKIMIIGGAQLYNATINIADEMWITHINHDFDGDTYFPTVRESDWNIRVSQPYGLAPFKTYSSEYNFDIKHYTKLGINAKN